MTQASDEKKFFKISEVAEKFKVQASLLRFWEKEFKALNPQKTKRGDRLYSLQDIEVIEQIYQLVKIQGYTLQGARELMTLQKDKLTHNQRVVKKLKNIRLFLEQLRKDLD